MEFQEQTIQFKTWLGDRPITAMVGIGSGLAYHRKDDSESEDFVLTHIKSGIDIGSDWYAWDEQDAKGWLEKVAKLLDWTKPLKSVKAEVKRLGGMDAMREQVTQALRDAWEENKAQDDAATIEDGVPANWPQEPLSIKTIRE